MRSLALAVLLPAAILLGLANDASAFGRGRGFAHSSGHFHGGFHSGFRTRVFVGAPLLVAPLAYPYYYAPAPVYYAPPPAYVEQPSYAPAPQSYWYYCAPARAYYPYVSDCPGGWQRVVPNNAPPPPAG